MNDSKILHDRRAATLLVPLGFRVGQMNLGGDRTGKYPWGGRWFHRLYDSVIYNPYTETWKYFIRAHEQRVLVDTSARYLCRRGLLKKQPTEQVMVGKDTRWTWSGRGLKSLMKLLNDMEGRRMTSEQIEEKHVALPRRG